MMQFIKTVARLAIIILLPFAGFAQSTYLPQGSKYEHFLDRMGILLQDNSDLNAYTPKPLSRKVAVTVAELADSLHKFYPYDEYYHLSKTDQATLQSLLMNNSEWVTGSKDSFDSKHPIWNTIYKNKADFLQVNNKDVFLAINPVLDLTQSVETGHTLRPSLNSKGITVRGMIAGHLGFSTFITDNQERGPQFFTDRVQNNGFPAVPGAGYYKTNSNNKYDYFDARGSVNFEFWKYFTAQFGYDKNFIGNGYRSLFLSDYAAPNLFLKLNARIGRVNYQAMLMELVSQHPNTTGIDYQYPKKYAVVHHLSVNATTWLNLGLYDNVVFSRANHFDFSYLNPIIFLVAAQQENGSPDKTTVGLDFKANIGHQAQLYGQLMINEFVLHEVLHYKDGWWGNKQGLQLGAKFIDVFNVKNLDLQLETNLVRPYAYSHDDTVSNYSHYNQPLAHPLGSNFIEFIAIARYQPVYKWNAELKVIYYRQGLDSGGINYGGNIFLNYNTRPAEYGVTLPNGVVGNCINTSGYVSYQWKENLFLEGTIMYRTYTTHDGFTPKESSTTFTLGVRVNMFRRMYDY